MIDVLRVVGLDGRDITIIRNLCRNQEGCVRTEAGNTKPIYMQRGVLQGCILSSSLFNMFAGVIVNSIRYDDDKQTPKNDCSYF